MSYTYLIGWSKLDKWYYGVRMSKLAKPEELMITYHTSSKPVAEHIKLYGNPDVVCIRKTFEDGENAYKWETRVLRRLKVASNPKWINCHENYPLSPFNSIEFEKMMIKRHGVKSVSEMKHVKQIVSQKLSGRMSVYDVELCEFIYVSVDMYKGNRERYLHPSSYKCRNLLGNTSKQTKSNINYLGTIVAYDTSTKQNVKISKETFDADVRYISINSKEFNMLRKTPRKKNISALGKELVVDSVERKVVQISTQLRKDYPDRYFHINSTVGKQLKMSLVSD